MKTLCITGILQSDLDGIARLFVQAGMCPARPVKRDEAMDIVQWHQQIIALEHEEMGSFQPIEHPGRLWEQLAGDIFLANMKSKLWGWGDASSIWLLDFWATFEPRIQFVLVSTSPERMLAAAIENGEAIGDLDQRLADWQAAHQEILRFYHRNSARCLLVDAADTLANPAELMRRCNALWKTSLDASADFSVHVVERDVLAMYLAQDVCRGHQAPASVQGELEATMVSLGKAAEKPLTDVTRLIAEYRRLKDCSAAAQKIAELQAAMESSSRENEGCHRRIDQLSQENDRLRQANEEAATRVSANEFSTAQARIKDVEQENELLLLQLHQVQEELEHYFLLHQEVQQKLKAADARWQRMLQRSPDYIDFSAVLASANEDGIHWRIENLDAAGRTFPLVEFDTLVVQDCACYRFSPDAHPLVRWPACLAEGQPLEIMPVGSQESQAERLQSLVDLATSDWELLGALSRVLKQTLAAPDALANARDLPLDALAKGFDVLDQVFMKFPAVLRFDGVGLKREQVNPDYEHLWLRLGQLSLGEHCWPEFEFRLSCANVRPKKFGSHPKLEFPAETGQAPFDAWFEESYDDFGAKFELRFALPDAMDMAVWGQVSDRDRLFLKLLVQRLPAILSVLEHDGIKLKRAWKDWVKLAEETQNILAMHGG